MRRGLADSRENAGCGTSWRQRHDAEVSAAGFDGLEGQGPADPAARDALVHALRIHGLDFIAEATTAGSYVPDRRATVEQHLVSLAADLARIAPLGPRLVNCIGGCDAWPFSQSPSTQPDWMST